MPKEPRVKTTLPALVALTLPLIAWQLKPWACFNAIFPSGGRPAEAVGA